MTSTDFGDGTPTFVGPVELSGSCDWGGCNLDAVTVRWSRTHGYLPVCLSCSRTPHTPERRGPQAGMVAHKFEKGD